MRNSGWAKSVFQRQRRPGDLVFAVFFLALSVFLLSQLGNESQWIKGTKTFAQPMFWPAVSLIGMTFFAGCHCLGAYLSAKSSGRLTETLFWVRSVEYALWFMVYVWLVPKLGYLLSTIIFANFLVLRVGYRKKNYFISATVMAVVIVVAFKGFLSVKIPGGLIYEYLPQGIRNFMLLYL